jgi:hypothetical protein
MVSRRLGFNRFHSISIVEIIARMKAIVDHLTVRPFNKGQYHVLLPTYNGNWYLLISMNVAQDIHENFKKRYRQ